GTKENVKVASAVSRSLASGVPIGVQPSPTPGPCQPGIAGCEGKAWSRNGYTGLPCQTTFASQCGAVATRDASASAPGARKTDAGDDRGAEAALRHRQS